MLNVFFGSLFLYMNVFRFFKWNLRIIWIGILVFKYYIFYVLNWSFGIYLVFILCIFLFFVICFLDCNFCVWGLGIWYKWEGMLYIDMYIKRIVGVLLCVIIRKILYVCGKYGVFFILKCVCYYLWDIWFKIYRGM